MKIEEYLESLPEKIISGEDVQLLDKSFREIFDFIGLKGNDVFYHLGCGDGKGVRIAVEEYNVKDAKGIDNNEEKIKNAKTEFIEKDLSAKFMCKDIRDADISDATVVLFWFMNDNIINSMMEKFNRLKLGTKIITIWGPLPECLPEKVKFPYIVNTVPLKKAENLQDQLLAVFGVKCIDFVTAWEFAERYTKSIGPVGNDRFLTILQTLTIWINAKNLGVSCDDEVPESIKTYINIMKTHFDIDFEHLLK